MALEATISPSDAISAYHYDERQSKDQQHWPKITHSRIKHIDISFYFVGEAQEDGLIKIGYCLTEEMIADLITKLLPR